MTTEDRHDAEQNELALFTKKVAIVVVALLILLVAIAVIMAIIFFLFFVPYEFRVVSHAGLGIGAI